MKRTSSDLAVLGGRQAFDELRVVGRPNVGDRERLFRRLAEAMERRWLSNSGPLVREFESRVSEVVGAEHCIAVCNATLGLEVALRVLGVSGEVIVPSFTFVATAHAVRWLGLTPVFVDIHPETHNLDPDAVEQAITERTSAIIGVHLWGRPLGADALQALSRARDVRCIFDAAHAFGCSYGGRMVGNFGDLEVFSFHATKFVNAFEGGAIVTRDAEIARRVRAMVNFGIEKDRGVRMLGTNAKMSEASAAAGLTSLDAMADFLDANRANHRAYEEGLELVAGVRLLRYDEHESHNYQYVVAEIDAVQAGLTADELVTVLAAENVGAKRYFSPPLHRVPPYADEDRTAACELPVTDLVASRTLVLPTGTQLTRAEVATICDVLRVAVADAPSVRAALSVSASGVAAQVSS